MLTQMNGSRGEIQAVRSGEDQFWWAWFTTHYPMLGLWTPSHPLSLVLSAGRRTCYNSSCFTPVHGLWLQASSTTETTKTQGHMTRACSCPWTGHEKVRPGHDSSNMYNSSTVSHGLFVAKVTWIIKESCSLLWTCKFGDCESLAGSSSWYSPASFQTTLQLRENPYWSGSLV